MQKFATRTVVDKNGLWLQLPKRVLKERGTRSTYFDTVRKTTRTVDLVFGTGDREIHVDGRVKIPASLFGLTYDDVAVSVQTWPTDNGVRVQVKRI